MNGDMFKALDVYMERKKKPLVRDGTVVAVHSTSVQVRLSGSSQIQQAGRLEGVPLAPGDSVVLVRTERNAKWIAIGTAATASSGNNTKGRAADNFQMSPPSNIRVKTLQINQVAITWDAAYSSPVVFEVQIMNESDEPETILTTRGSYCIITVESEGVLFRIRSISGDHQISSPAAAVSAWTDWASASAVPESLTPTEQQSSSSNAFVYPLSGDPIEDGTPLITVDKGTLIRSIKLEVESPYPYLSSIEIGHQGNRSRFMAFSDNIPQLPGTYEVWPDIEMPDITTIRFYHNNGTQFLNGGTGRVIVYM